MSNITFTINFTGTPDSGDAEAARFAVDRANENRGTPLPVTPAGAMKTSYLTVLGELLTIEHSNNLAASADEHANQQQAFVRWEIATEAERTAALAQLPPLP